MCFRGVPRFDVQASGFLRHCPLFQAKQMFRNLAGPVSVFLWLVLLPLWFARPPMAACGLAPKKASQLAFRAPVDRNGSPSLNLLLFSDSV